MPGGAFLGNPALKDEILGRVHEGWGTGRITPLPFLKWSGGERIESLAGTIAKAQDPDEFSVRTGLTLELALLCETLINAGITFEDDKAAPLGFSMRADDAIWAFGPEWLSTIAVGQDVSDIVARFLPVFLRAILADDFALAGDIAPGVRAASFEILGLWECEARGEVVPRQVWRSVRDDALRATAEEGGPGGHAVAQLVESLPWPREGIAKEFPAICRKFLQSYQHVLAERQLDAQTRSDWNSLLAAEREILQLRSQPEYAILTEEALLDRFPDIRQAMSAAKLPDAAARIDAAVREARLQLVPFLRQQMDHLLKMLSEKTG